LPERLRISSSAPREIGGVAGDVAEQDMRQQLLVVEDVLRAVQLLPDGDPIATRSIQDLSEAAPRGRHDARACRQPPLRRARAHDRSTLSARDLPVRTAVEAPTVQKLSGCGRVLRDPFRMSCSAAPPSPRASGSCGAPSQPRDALGMARTAQRSPRRGSSPQAPRQALAPLL
jgi:hypothetical protein